MAAKFARALPRGLRSLGLAAAIAACAIAVGAPGQADPPPAPAARVAALEASWEAEYEAYFAEDLPADFKTLPELQAILRERETQTGKRSAVVYAAPQPDGLELVLATGEGDPVRRRLPEATPAAVADAARSLRVMLTDPRRRHLTAYREPARQLHDWLVAPLEPALEAQQIDTLIFCLGPSLRSLPLAALYDGDRFLVERYSLARIPGFSLTDTRYQSLRDARVLAMGASEFDSLAPLPAVPVEVATIAGLPQGSALPDEIRQLSPLWPGAAFLNDTFRRDVLQAQRRRGGFDIVHLATHAEFRSGAPAQSFIQFADGPLTLADLGTLDWTDPPVELLVLSACRTAVGDRQAEMGFAGLAIHSGVGAAVASLWAASDRGTLALMSEFYGHLRQAPTKSEALRRAQLALLRGETRIEGGQLRGSTRGAIALPPEIHAVGAETLRHPYYWAGFSVIGNPW